MSKKVLLSRFGAAKDDGQINNNLLGMECKIKKRRSRSCSNDIIFNKPPFNELLRNVKFSLSGFINPERSMLRSKCLEMGALYSVEWDETCTHLICAFPNTPKYNKAEGSGHIVTKEWINSCYEEKKLLSVENFRMEEIYIVDDEEPKNSDISQNSSSSFSLSPLKNKPEQQLNLDDPSGGFNEKSAELTDDMKLKIHRNKIEAMKKILNKYDVLIFNNVPDFIVETFFSSSNYKNRMLVTQFAYLNGIIYEDLIKMLHWKVISKSSANKMEKLMEEYFENPKDYYSYSVNTNAVMFINGDYRINGKRVKFQLGKYCRAN